MVAGIEKVKKDNKTFKEGYFICDKRSISAIKQEFFKRFYLRSDLKYDGQLNEPIKNTRYFYNLFLSKLNFLFIKLFY